MKLQADKPFEILVVVSPHFNVSATTSLLDPFRVANYLSGSTRFSWTYVSEQGGETESSSGLRIHTQPLQKVDEKMPWLVLVSTSWTPELHLSNLLRSKLRNWFKNGSIIGGLDTGAIVLANAGLLKGRTATVHYEHIDAFIEIAPDTLVSENMFVIEDQIFTCCGGTASTDMGLKLVHSIAGESIANAAARYLFHHVIQGDDASQKPFDSEPMGHITPDAVRNAIDLMELNLESTISIPEIAQQLKISQRQLSRLFKAHVRKSPIEYYRDIRLDRARGLVTQTELKLSEIAAASGFNSQVHFSRSYSQRFGMSPSEDRVHGRIPFEFRAWPMYKSDFKNEDSS